MEISDGFKCDGCGVEFRDYVPGFAELRSGRLAAAHRAGWQWCRQYAGRAHHFCPACVVAGKFQAFFESVSKPGTLSEVALAQLTNPQDVCENDTMQL